MALEIIRYVGALLLVLALIGAAGVAARKWGVPGVTRAVEQKRLAVVETLMMGPRQRLFIIRRDNADFRMRLPQIHHVSQAIRKDPIVRLHHLAISAIGRDAGKREVVVLYLGKK